MLEEYDHNKTNYTSSLWASHGNEDPRGDGEDLREERQIAFGTDACKFQDDKYWVNFLVEQSKLRKLGRGQQRSSSNSLKRRASVTTEHLAVEEEGHRSQSSIPESKRRRVHAHGSSHRPSTPARTSREHQRRQHSVTGAIQLSGNEVEGETVLENEIVAATNFPGNPHRVTQSVETSTRLAKNSRSTLSLPPARLGPDQCELILPHGEDKYLVINKDIIPKCSYLSTRNPSSSSSSKIDLTHDQRANDVQLAATDFSAVLQFYQTGDIGPRFIINNNNSNKPLQFSPLDLSPDQKAIHVESLAKAYVTAVKIQDENLQHLIFQKLQLLGSSSSSSYPFSSLSILILASCFSHLAALKTTAHIEKDATENDNHDEISLWVLDLVKNHYWLLVRNHIDELQTLFEHNHSMRRAVYDFLRGNPLGGREG